MYRSYIVNLFFGGCGLNRYIIKKEPLITGVLNAFSVRSFLLFVFGGDGRNTYINAFLVLYAMHFFGCEGKLRNNILLFGIAVE